jgi:hypothetical protein
VVRKIWSGRTRRLEKRRIVGDAVENLGSKCRLPNA